jgi:hypothetical protein
LPRLDRGRQSAGFVARDRALAAPVGAAAEQFGELLLLCAREPCEDRGFRERGDETSSGLSPGVRECQCLDAPVCFDGRARDESPTLKAVNEECDVRRVAVKALGELSPRLRPELWIELPEDVGEGNRQVELDQCFVKCVLQSGVDGIRGLREVVPDP